MDDTKGPIAWFGCPVVGRLGRMKAHGGDLLRMARELLH